MVTLGDVRKYLNEATGPKLILALTIPFYQTQYANALCALFKRISRDQLLPISEIAEPDGDYLADTDELSPEAEQLFSKFKATVKALVDTL